MGASRTERNEQAKGRQRRAGREEEEEGDLDAFRRGRTSRRRPVVTSHRQLKNDGSSPCSCTFPPTLSQCEKESTLSLEGLEDW